MSTRVGLGIGRDAVRGILVRRGKVVWSCETPVTDDAGLRAAVAEVLQAMPRSRGRRRRVVAAIGPAATQLKRLTSANSTSEALLGEAVQKNAGRFFLRNGVPLRVSRLRREPDAGAWIAAAEAPLLADIEEACREARLRYQGAVPALAALHYALQSGGVSRTVTWHDDDIIGLATFEAGRLVQSRRSLPDDSVCGEVDLVPALKVLNGQGWRLADAFSAAVVDVRDPLCFRPLADATRLRRRERLRRIFLFALCALMGTLALFAPGVLAIRAQSDAAERLAALSSRQRDISTAQAELAQVSHALQRAGDFVVGRTMMSQFLSSLTEKAPQTTAVLNLHVDSAGGSVLALSPHGAEVFAAIGQLPRVTSARITAPLMTETVGSNELERVAVRFEFAAKPPARKPSRPARSP